MIRTLGVAGLLLATAATLASDAAGPQPSTHSQGTTRCFTRLERVADLVVPDSSRLGGTTVAVRDGRGYVFVVHAGDIETILVFDPTGSFLGSLVVPKRPAGSLPLNFTALATSPGDSLLAFNSFGPSMAVYGPTLELARVVPLPDGQVHDVAVLGPDTLAVSGPVLTPDRVGLPVHLIALGREGIVRSFGSHDEVRRPDIAHMDTRVVARASAGVWMSRVTEYTIELWDRSGDRLLTWPLRRDWFEPWFQGRATSPETGPRPQLLDLAEDEGGRLHTLSVTADSHWTEGVDDELFTTDYARARDTYLEVILPSERKTIESCRFSGHFTVLLDARHVLRVDGSLADATYSVWRRMPSVPGAPGPSQSRHVLSSLQGESP